MLSLHPVPRPWVSAPLCAGCPAGELRCCINSPVLRLAELAWGLQTGPLATVRLLALPGAQVRPYEVVFTTTRDACSFHHAEHGCELDIRLRPTVCRSYVCAAALEAEGISQADYGARNVAFYQPEGEFNSRMRTVAEALDCSLLHNRYRLFALLRRAELPR